MSVNTFLYLWSQRVRSVCLQWAQIAREWCVGRKTGCELVCQPSLLRCDTKLSCVTVLYRLQCVICLSVPLSVPLCVCLFVSVCLSVYLSVCVGEDDVLWSLWPRLSHVLCRSQSDSRWSLGMSKLCSRRCYSS